MPTGDSAAAEALSLGPSFVQALVAHPRTSPSSRRSFIGGRLFRTIRKLRPRANNNITSGSLLEMQAHCHFSLHFRARPRLDRSQRDSRADSFRPRTHLALTRCVRGTALALLRPQARRRTVAGLLGPTVVGHITRGQATGLLRSGVAIEATRVARGAGAPLLRISRLRVHDQRCSQAADRHRQH